MTCTCRKQPGVRYPSLCRPVERHKAGCPSGQRERSVKPSATPSQVRILDLPPPAETCHGLRILRSFRPSAPVPSCPTRSSGVPLFAAVYGHIADRIRDHEAHSAARPWATVLGRARPSMPSRPGLHSGGCLRAKALPLAMQRARDGGLVSPSRLYYGIWTLWDLDTGGRGRKERHVRPVGACHWVLELNVPPSCVADLRFPASRLRVRCSVRFPAATSCDFMIMPAEIRCNRPGLGAASYGPLPGWNATSEQTWSKHDDGPRA